MSATLREQVIQLFAAAFGDAEITTVKSGDIHRWTLPRGRYGVSMFITIDSPEYADVAHVMISDAAAYQADPVVSISIYTLPEAEVIITRITRQWKASGETPPK